MALIAGIDEAGRGPCIGPLVICAYMIDEKDMGLLANIGAKDSKLLSAPKRQKMFAELQKAAKAYELIEIQPAEIDAAVESETTNLNWLEAEKAAIMLNKLNPDIAIIDCPSPNLKAYKDFIMGLLKKKTMELVIEHKAERHLPVAAASIIAKVTRDKRIEEIKKEIEQSPYKDKIIQTGWMNAKDLARVVSGAEVFLYPGLYEGFGLSVLEAMAAGTPVVTSHGSALEEAGGDACVYVNPEDTLEITNALADLLNNENLRKENISKGLERVKNFSWAKCAELTLNHLTT